jgi:hypothetical protein|uniref:Uncharacterized protein n=1 Tax=Caudovirales sp. ct1Jx6 TaxID=2826765 RepID=A0A8S5MLI0_9CAUD|nr:MAG TPA: hypothetical protein [Caudovirales sp. ct1Jx6]
MDREIIFKESYNKYCKVSMPTGTSMSGNENFEKLMFFIGQHKHYRDKKEIGSAYVVIREKTNALLGIDRRNVVLRTSKREVASLKRYFNTGKSDGAVYAKIPFKVAYIFKAISILVEEIHQDGFEIDAGLKSFVNMTYSKAFYEEYIDAYDDVKEDIPVNKTAQRALGGDFHSPDSPMNNIFR